LEVNLYIQISYGIAILFSPKKSHRDQAAVSTTAAKDWRVKLRSGEDIPSRPSGKKSGRIGFGNGGYLTTRRACLNRAKFIAEKRQGSMAPAVVIGGGKPETGFS
jgi:hypothetical protein